MLEGSKVKDKATLSGKNASKATGKVKYAVYSESACKTLVTSAGEVSVSGESVPASSEEELEGGKTYYWQAHYGGDTNNGESTSPCTEVLNVKAKTILSTTLSGEGKEAEELTVIEGSKVKDKATLMGTNSSTATGKALYKIYSEKECKTLVKEAGEVTVSGGSIPASSEEELEGGKTYYWQVTYKGDGLHQESTSSCSEILTVKTAPAPRIEQVAFPNSEEIVADHLHEIAFTQIEKEEAEKQATLEKEGKELPVEGPLGEHESPTERPKDEEEPVGRTEVEGSSSAWWEATYSGEMVKNWPVSEPGGSTIGVTARFGIDSATKEHVEKRLEGNVTFAGETTIGGVKITFTDTLSRSEVLSQLSEHSTYLATNKTVSASSALPDEFLYEEPAISWRWTVTEKEHGTKEEATGESKHDLYVMDAPLPGFKKYETLQDIVEKAMTAAGLGAKPTEQKRIEALSKAFSTKKINYRTLNPKTGKITEQATPMRYYKEIKPVESVSAEFKQEFETGGKNIRDTCNGIAALLRKGEGRCGAWAEAFQYGLAYAGVESELISLEVEFGAAPEPCATRGECILLVDNWKFEKPGTGAFPYAAANVQDEAGVAGQGIANPPGFYWDHEIDKVKPKDSSGPSALYDPSYGTGPFKGTTYKAVLEGYEASSLTGFCRSTTGKKRTAGGKLEAPSACRSGLPIGEEGLYAEEDGKSRKMEWP